MGFYPFFPSGGGGSPSGPAGGDLSGSYPNPQVTGSGGVPFGAAAFITLPASIANGGTGQTTAAAAYNALSPMTTLGDIEYEAGASTAARLAGNTTATKNFLTQTGTGSVSAAPAWGTIAAGDVPTLNQNTTGTAAGLSATLAIGSGGTGQVTAAAAYNALSPMTTKGDMEYDSAGGTAARLAVGTQAGATGQFLGNSAGIPAWQNVSGQYLCTPTQYAPTTRATFTTTSSTLSAVSSANISTGSFTAPPSGSVVVTVGLIYSTATAGNHIALALAAHGTVTPVVGNVQIVTTGTTNAVEGSFLFIVTGLTAGNTYNLDLLFSAPEGTTAVNVFSFGVTSTTPAGTSGAPTVMTVQAV